MENRWIKATTILPPTLEVCGTRLLPFCLRHRAALEAIDSPVLHTDRDVRPDDLMAAVRILSTDKLEEMRRPTTWREEIWSVRMKGNRRLFVGEAAKVLIYFQAQSLWPRFWQKTDKPKNSGIPWILGLIANLMRNGCTYEEAWTMPEAEAIWLNMAHAHAEGADVQIVSDTEWQAMNDYLARQKAKAETPNPRAN